MNDPSSPFTSGDDRGRSLVGARFGAGASRSGGERPPPPPPVVITRPNVVAPSIPPGWSDPGSAGELDSLGYVWGSRPSAYLAPEPVVKPRAATSTAAAPPFALPEPPTVAAAGPAIAPVGAPPKPAREKRGRLAAGLTFALFVFFALSLVSVTLSWLDTTVRPPGLAEAITGYGVCSGLVVVAMLFPGRWRSIPVLLATVAGVLLPLYLVRDLLDTLGVHDLWVGQSLTLGVLFPLLVGGTATIAILRRPRRRAGR